MSKKKKNSVNLPLSEYENLMEYKRKANQIILTDAFRSSPKQPQLLTGDIHYEDFEDDYRKHLINISTVLFRWENLPEGVDPNILEEDLILTGRAVIRDLEDTGIFINGKLENEGEGEHDIYGMPLKYTLRTRSNRVGSSSSSQNAQRVLCDRGNSVIIYNNLRGEGIMEKIDITARLLAQIRITQLVNMDQQNTQKLLFVDPADREDAERLIAERSQYKPYVILDKKNREDIVESEVQSTGTPFTANELEIYKSHVLNEFYTSVGIDNANLMKSERMVSDEIEANDGQITAARESMLRTRQAAAEELNKKFGLNVKVDFRESDDEEMKELYDLHRIMRIKAETKRMELDAKLAEMKIKELDEYGIIYEGDDLDDDTENEMEQTGNEESDI